jgi:hypothetical protein
MAMRSRKLLVGGCWPGRSFPGVSAYLPYGPANQRRHRDQGAVRGDQRSDNGGDRHRSASPLLRAVGGRHLHDVLRRRREIAGIHTHAQPGGLRGGVENLQIARSSVSSTSCPKSAGRRCSSTSSIAPAKGFTRSRRIWRLRACPTRKGSVGRWAPNRRLPQARTASIGCPQESKSPGAS